MADSPYTDITHCPQCRYNFTGLPPAGRCPECGFAYDTDMLFVTGVARGLSALKPWTVALWILVGLLGHCMPQLFMQAFFSSQMAGVLGMLIAGAIWFALLVFLILKARHKTGMRQYLFCKEGFGPVPNPDPSQQQIIELTPWSPTTVIEIKRVGSFWRRLRVGRCLPTDPDTLCFAATGPMSPAGKKKGVKLKPLYLDIGIRCHDQGEAAFRSRLEQLVKCDQLKLG